jgi:hypothetical protein
VSVGFPGTGYPVTELLIDGVWTDVSGYVLGQAGTSGIAITRGGAEGQGSVSACTSSFQLDNRDGRFFNRNPSSTYYGLLTRNTQVRHTAGSGDTFLWMPYDDQDATDEARTADKAVLDITGDLEIRMDIHPHTWRPDSRLTGTLSMIIASKYKITGDQRSWAVWLYSDGTIGFVWSSDGTSAGRVFATSTSAISATNGRFSIKVTLDVNNGTGGADVKFWTSSSIAGTYSQLGSTVTSVGVSSVFSSTADLCLGTGSDSNTIFGTTGMTFGGRVYEFRLYNGIGGTLVANPNFTSQTIGATSFSDGLGTPNTWTISGDPRITSDRIRFHGELSTLPQVWDSTGNSVYVPAQAGGMLRRLQRAGAPLRSPMFRQFSQYTSLTGYWPLEDSTGAQTAANYVSGGTPARASGVTFGETAGSSTTLTGAATSVQFNSTTSQILASCSTASAGTIFMMVFLKISAMPASQKTLLLLYTSGTARRIEIGLDATNWHFDFYAADGSNLSSQTTGAGGVLPTGWIGLNLLLETSGGNVSWSARWHNAGAGSTFLGIGAFTFAGAVGRATQVRITAQNDAVYQDAQFGHLLTASADLGFVTFAISNAHDAYAGDTAAERFARLCDEESLPYEITGMWDQSASMGVQRADTVVNLLNECAEADMGMMGEARDMLALTYRTRHDLEARWDAELDYSAAVLAEPPVPTEDDLFTTNDVTAARVGGSSFRKVLTAGAMSTAAPPDGVGPYPRDVSVNVEADADLGDVAGWRLNLGTIDEARYPNLQIALNRTELTGDSALAERVRGLDAGDTVIFSNLPSFLPPDDVPLIIHGYAETLTHYLWTVAFNTAPASAYRTGVYNQTNNRDERIRYDTSGSTLNTGITSSGTTIILDSTDTDDTWTTTSGSYPFDIMIEGEQITLNNAPGATSPQTFTGCTRSVNGVVKAHSAGVAASLAVPFRWA